MFSADSWAERHLEAHPLPLLNLTPVLVALGSLSLGSWSCFKKT